MEVKWVSTADKKPIETRFGFSDPLVVFTDYGNLNLGVYNFKRDTWEFISPTIRDEVVIAWLGGLKWE